MSTSPTNAALSTGSASASPVDSGSKPVHAKSQSPRMPAPPPPTPAHDPSKAMAKLSLMSEEERQKAREDLAEVINQPNSPLSDHDEQPSHFDFLAKSFTAQSAAAAASAQAMGASSTDTGARSAHVVKKLLKAPKPSVVDLFGDDDCLADDEHPAGAGSKPPLAASSAADDANSSSLSFKPPALQRTFSNQQGSIPKSKTALFKGTSVAEEEAADDDSGLEDDSGDFFGPFVSGKPGNETQAGKPKGQRLALPRSHKSGDDLTPQLSRSRSKMPANAAAYVDSPRPQASVVVKKAGNASVSGVYGDDDEFGDIDDFSAPPPTLQRQASSSANLPKSDTALFRGTTADAGAEAGDDSGLDDHLDSPSLAVSPEPDEDPHGQQPPNEEV